MRKRTHLGERYKSADGYMCEVVLYNSYHDFWLKFDDDNKEVHRSDFRSIKNGTFTKKGCLNRYTVVSDEELLYRKTLHVTNKQGYGMRIKDFHTPDIVDVVFDDGVCATKKRYVNFKKGCIFHPKYKTLKYSEFNRIIENNQIEKIIEYNNKQSLVVQLNDGCVVNTTYANCINSTIDLHNNKIDLKIIKKLKTIKKIKKKHTCSISVIHKDGTVDIIFDDGAKIKNMNWTDYRDGHFDYPSDNYDELCKKRAIKKIMHGYKKGARKRGLPFKLSYDEFKSLILSPCAYTGIEYSNTLTVNGYQFKYNGIDRIDPKNGYVVGNVVPCCININKAKSNLTIEDFYSLIITTHIYNMNNNQTYQRLYANSISV